jgi:hypothetical protein
MTIQIDGTDLVQLAETAAWLGGIVTTLLVCLIVYLLVRPPRHVREARKAGRIADPAETEELWALVERMDGRLEVLERALADRVEEPATRRAPAEQVLAPAGDGRDSGRK